MHSQLRFGVSTWKHKDWLWRAHRLLWGVDFVHCYVGFAYGEKDLVFHSNYHGTNVVCREAFIRSGRIPHTEWCIPVDEASFKEFVDHAFSSVMTPFSRLQMIGAGAAWVLRSKGNWLRRPGCEICSLTAGRVLARWAGGDFLGKDPLTYTPYDFYRELNYLEISGRAERIRG